MKKTGFLIFVILISGTFTKSQSVDDGRVNKKNEISAAANPVYNATTDKFGMFIHGDYGLTSKSDIGLQVGFGPNQTYLGIDFERLLIKKPAISAYAGAHYHQYAGLDLGSKITLPLRPIFLTTGLDMDMVLSEDENGNPEILIPVWLPVQIEFYLIKHVSMAFEAQVALNTKTNTYVGTGILVYF